MTISRYRFFVAGLILVIGIFKIADILKSNSSYTDGWGFNTESDRVCIDAGAHYYEQGFGKFFGLPNKSYRDDKLNPFRSLDIYKHYPPGAEMLTGLMYFPCGGNNFKCLRILPLIFSISIMAIFFLFLPKIMGPVAAAAVVLILAATPMFHNGMTVLAFHAYALGLQLLALIVLFRFTLLNDLNRRKAFFVLALLSFLQGLFSLDHALITAFLPLPFYFLNRDRGRDLIVASVVSGAAFLAAFGLHFLQVAGYEGSLAGAVKVFTEAGKYRLYGHADPFGWIKEHNLRPLNVLRRQLDVYSPHPSNFGFPAQILIYLVFVGAFFKSGLLRGRWKPVDSPWLIAAAFAIAALWSLLFRHHSWSHAFVNRHFFVPYFFALFVAARAFGQQGKRTEIHSGAGVASR
jgi:hypothetical protein